MLQLRRLGGNDNRFYSPDRDCAHYGVNQIRKTFDLLENDLNDFSAKIKNNIEDYKLEDLESTAVKIAELINCVPKRDVKSFDDAVNNVNLFDNNFIAIVHFLSTLGFLQLMAVFNGMRDVTPAKGETPLDIEGLFADCKILVNKHLCKEATNVSEG